MQWNRLIPQYCPAVLQVRIKFKELAQALFQKVLDTELYDEVITIENEEAFAASREVARTNGILVGISSGAALAAAKKVAKQLGKGKKVLAILPDTGERYLSTALFQFEEE